MEELITYQNLKHREKGENTGFSVGRGGRKLSGWEPDSLGGDWSRLLEVGSL